MRKIINPIVIFIVIFPLLLGALEPDIKNLKGLNYVRFQCEYNGIPFFKGYKNLKEQRLEEYNLAEIETQLSEAGIPIGKDNIRAVYNQVEALLKNAGVRVVSIGTNDDKSGLSVLPTVSIDIKVIKASKKVYVSSVDLIVSNWISTWSGTQNIQTQVITWWQKKLLADAPAELNKSIEKTVKELFDDFVIQLKEANTEEEEKEEEKETGKKKKEVLP